MFIGTHESVYQLCDVAEKVTELEEELEASSTECLLEKEKNSQLQASFITVKLSLVI